VEDVSRTNAVVADMRKIIRQDPRIIQKLHRRVFLDKLTREQARPPRRPARPRALRALRALAPRRLGRARRERVAACVRAASPCHAPGICNLLPPCASSECSRKQAGLRPTHESMQREQLVPVKLSGKWRQAERLPRQRGAYARPPRRAAQVSVYVSFYVEAANRDAFMAVKQDLLLAFIDCVERNGAKLAKQLLQARAARRPGRARRSAPAAGPRWRGSHALAQSVVIQAAVHLIGSGLGLPKARAPGAQVEVVAQALPAGRGAAAAAGAGAPADAPPGAPGAPLLTLPEGRGQQGPSVEVAPSGPAAGGAGAGRGGAPGAGEPAGADLAGAGGRAAPRGDLTREPLRAQVTRAASLALHECQHDVASCSGSARYVVHVGGLAAARRAIMACDK
jgi:hypothetical protein